MYKTSTNEVLANVHYYFPFMSKPANEENGERSRQIKMDGFIVSI
jgi:hypothetical protein